MTTSRGSSDDTWEPAAPSDPVVVGDVVDAVLGKISRGSAATVLRLRANWRDVAGPKLAERCVPVAVADGTVLVEVDDGATASLMRFESANLARRASNIVGESITGVRIRVRRSS